MKKIVWLAAILAVVAGLLLSAASIGHKNWAGRGRFTVVFFEKERILVKSFDPKTGRGLELTVPANLEVDTLAGRGRFTAGSLVAAGGSEWAAQSLGHYLGIFVRGSWRDLSIWDRVNWWRYFTKIDWESVDLSRTGYLEYVDTVDGVRVARLAPGWDQRAGLWFSSLEIAGESLTVEVVNTTGTAGLAVQAARLIESSGIKVSRVSPNDQNLNGCLLTTPADIRQSAGAGLLLSEFDCDWREDQTNVLYLGQKYRKALFGD